MCCFIQYIVLYASFCAPYFMSGFVRNYFENSYKEMVSFFAKDQKISANDLKDIIDMIEKGKE